MSTSNKSLVAAFVALGLTVTSIALPSTALAAANLNGNGKNANGVARSTKNTMPEPKIDIEEHADAHVNEHAKNTGNKPVVITTLVSGNDQEKVRICHRTASYGNPYVSITVARAAVDGIAGNSGNQADHYGEHKGPVFNSNLPKHTEWGDIIPALNAGHNGQNWNNAGRAIYNNGCKLPKSAPVLLASITASKPIADPASSATPATSQLANTGASTWITSLISISTITISALLGLLTRRKLSNA